MTITRRQFLRSVGLSTAFLALPAWLSACGHDIGPTVQTLSDVDVWEAAPTNADDAAIVHGLNRITYGPRPGDVARVAQMGWDAFLDQQLNPEQIDDSVLDTQLAAFPTLSMSAAELITSYPLKGQPGPRRVVAELEAASLLRAIASERQLFEIMVDFWSSHLNIYIGKNQARWFKTIDDRAVVRKYALGKFRDLLLASAKSPAMLIYLDNAENVRPGATLGKQANGLNENYAREVMELHTVGAVFPGYTSFDFCGIARDA